MEYKLPHPQGKTESARLDLQHQTWLIRFDNALHLAPLHPCNTPIRVLDAGCGTGIWATEFALAREEAKVVAVDLSPPLLTNKPQNLQIIEGNLEKDWTFAHEGEYAFIKAKMLTFAIRDWPTFLAKCWHHLAPGGWVEIIDGSQPLTAENPLKNVDNSAFLRNGALQEHAWRNYGIDSRACDRHTDRLKLLGFQNVSEHDFRGFLGDWPENDVDKAIGVNEKRNWLELMEKHNSALLINLLKMDKADAERVTADMLKDVKENSNDGKYSFGAKCVIAQKPA